MIHPRHCVPLSEAGSTIRFTSLPSASNSEPCTARNCGKPRPIENRTSSERWHTSSKRQAPDRSSGSCGNASIKPNREANKLPAKDSLQTLPDFGLREGTFFQVRNCCCSLDPEH